MGTEDILLGLPLRWTSIPSRVAGGGGGVQYFQILHATETGMKIFNISSGHVGLLGSCMTLPLPFIVTKW